MAITMTELARLVGVCPATVSRVLNESGSVSERTRARVLAGIERHHYQPNELARGLVNGKSRTVGVVASRLDNPFYAAVLMGIERALSTAGYSWLLTLSTHDAAQERQHLQELRKRKVDGLIINPALAPDGQYPNADLIHALRRDGVPLVVLHDYFRETNTHSIAYDIFGGVCQAIDHLVELGHRRIGFVSPVWRAPVNETGGPNHRVRGYIMGLNRPTALLSHNDTVAVGVMHGLRTVGKRVPADVSVVGFDNTEICDYLPTPLTSVSLPKEELGQHAVRLVLAAIERGEEPETRPEEVSLPTELVVRASTGPAPG
jgi:DNA-binding LacI/PurR family transcriptional regulator